MFLLRYTTTTTTTTTPGMNAFDTVVINGHVRRWGVMLAWQSQPCRPWIFGVLVLSFRSTEGVSIAANLCGVSHLGRCYQGSRDRGSVRIRVCLGMKGDLWRPRRVGRRTPTTSGSSMGCPRYGECQCYLLGVSFGGLAGVRLS